MYTIVKVKWLDSSEIHGWIDKENLDVNCRVEIVETIGFLVMETDEFISVSNSVSEQAVNSPLTIPKFAINEINHV